MLKQRQNQNIPYNPETFMQLHIRRILPEAVFEVINITFSGYLQKWFHTGNRPIGYVEIIYKDQNEFIKKKKLFIKVHKEAGKAFDTIKRLYTELNNELVIERIPEPVICDYKNNVMFFQYVDGIPLNQHIVRRLLYSRSTHTAEIACSLKEIGTWLSRFHEATKTSRTTTVSNLTEQITDHLKEKTTFNTSECEILGDTLKKHANGLVKDRLLSQVQTHKDFNLRNVFMTRNNHFHVIDWDAMVHNEFRDACSIWIDITKFTISIKSLLRFRPLLSRKIVNIFLASFLEGYFGDSYYKTRKELDYLLWVFTLAFSIGLIGDRSLPNIYTNILGDRFISELKENILLGPAYISSI